MSLLNSPNPDAKRAIEAFRESVQQGYHAYSKAPAANRFEGINLNDPPPDTATPRVCKKYDDGPEGCGLPGDPYANAPTEPGNKPQ
jgi:hypothetical protein